jgi:uncharacterized glyoxalase superfamily protein PhnB
MQSLTPNIFVKDINATIAFYQALGFQLVASVPESGDYVWVMMVNSAVTMMFQTYDSLGEDLPNIHRQDGGSLLLYIKLKNIRKYFEDIKQMVTVLKPLEKTFYGATEFSILDNNGYVLTFAEDEETVNN